MKNKIHISKMTGKLAGFNSINTNPLTNNFCNKMRNSGICKECYSCKMLSTFRVSCVPSFQRNNELLSSTIIEDKDIPFINNAYFRFHSHGELINSIHFINFINIANKNKQTTFTLWTKRKDIVQKCKIKIPENLIMVYSSHKINVQENIPDKFNKVFTVFSNENIAKINCSKHCSTCMLCYTKNDTIYVNELLK